MPNLVELRINEHTIYNEILFNNFIFYSLKLEIFWLARGDCIINNYNVYLPNIQSLHLNNVDLCNDVGCCGNAFHISLLFGQNNDSCNENIYGLENRKNLKI